MDTLKVEAARPDWMLCVPFVGVDEMDIAVPAVTGGESLKSPFSSVAL